MKSFVRNHRAAERERKYPVLVALDVLFYRLLCAALVACALAILGWVAMQAMPHWGAKVTSLVKPATR